MGSNTYAGNSIRENIQNVAICEWNTVFGQFVDPDGNLVDVSDARVYVRSGRYDPSDPDGLIVSGASANNFSTGTYSYVLTPELEPGYYWLTFAGTLTSGNAPVSSGYTGVTLPVTLCSEGQFQVLERTIEMDMVLRIRRRLKDLNTRLYRLDLPVQKWSDDEIIDAIYKGLGEVNMQPPLRTNYELRGLPTGSWTFVMDIAFADLLESMAVLENANTYSMSDGSANLSLSRAQMYQQIAQSTRSRISQNLAAWKRSIMPHTYGQGTSQYPFHIRHVLSFLPNMKNVFGA